MQEWVTGETVRDGLSVLTQDSIDLFLGNYAAEEADWTTPLRDPKDWKFLTVREVLEVILTNLFFPICLMWTWFSPFLVAHRHGGSVLHVHHLPADGW